MKEKARLEAKIAVRKGQLVTQPCEKCGYEHGHKHHEDYSKPLDVKWLCSSCHPAYHGWLKKQDRSETGLYEKWIATGILPARPRRSPPNREKLATAFLTVPLLPSHAALMTGRYRGTPRNLVSAAIYTLEMAYTRSRQAIEPEAKPRAMKMYDLLSAVYVHGFTPELADSINSVLEAVQGDKRLKLRPLPKEGAIIKTLRISTHAEAAINRMVGILGGTQADVVHTALAVQLEEDARYRTLVTQPECN